MGSTRTARDRGRCESGCRFRQLRRSTRARRTGAVALNFSPAGGTRNGATVSSGGDKKYVLPSLRDQFSGQVNLVYIDPPFFTGTDQQIVIRISDDEFFEKEPSLVEE